MAGLQGIKGLFARGKKGWLYYQPPTPKGGKRPVMVALETTDLVEAIKRMNKLNVDGAVERAKVEGTLKEVLPVYYAAKREDRAATRRSRRVILDAFMNDMGNPRADRITAEMVEAWRAGLEKRGKRQANPRKKRAGVVAAVSPTLPTGPVKPLSGTTIKTYTITLRAFVNWLLEKEILRVDPMAKLKRQTRVAATRQHEFLDLNERERVLAVEAAVEADLTLHLGFFGGFRDKEILAMTPDWIWISPDGSRGTITVQETPIVFVDGSHGMWKPKVLHLRTVTMHSRLLACLNRHGVRGPFIVAPHKDRWPMDEKNSKRYDARKALETIGKRAGVKKLNFHMMRHTFATLLVMAGVPLREVAHLLGDSLAVTEKHYAGYAPGRVNPVELI